MNFIFPAKRNETERSEGISRLNPVKETQISRLHCTMFRHEWSDGFRSHLKNEQKRREGKGEKGNLDALMDVGTRYCLAAGARKRYMALDTLSLVRDTSRAAEHFSQQYLRDLAHPPLPLLPRVRCAVSNVPSPPSKRVTECIPLPLGMHGLYRNVQKIYRVIGHFGMPDTIDGSNWEKFIGGEDCYKCLYNITSIFNLHGQESSFERRYIYIYRSLSEDESISEMERRKRREIDGRSVLLRVLILVSRDVIIRRNTRERAALIRRIGL